MKSIIFLALLLVSSVNASLGAGPLRIDALQAIEINGSKQWVLIRSSDPSNPILLYLHGGPGHSLIPFAHVATSYLTDRFTVVYWDQRGAGLSYEAGFPAEKLNVKQLIEDTLAVTEYLQQRFAQKRIFLLGHSWGSLLGSLVVQQKPGEFHAFIGVGQVVSQRSLNEARLAWLTTVMKPVLSYKDRNELAAVKQGDPVPIRYIRKYGGFIHNISPEQLQAIMASSPYGPEKYTAALYDKGYELSQGRLENEVLNIDLSKQAVEYRLPVYFFLGKYDYVTPTAPVVEYFERLRAPHKECGWFENSGHRMDVEEPDRFQQELIEKLFSRKE